MEDAPTPPGNGTGDDWRYRAVTSELDEFKRSVSGTLDKIVLQMERDREATRAEIKSLADRGQPDLKFWLGGLVGLVTVFYLIVDKEASLVAQPLTSDLRVAMSDLRDLKDWQRDANNALQENKSADASSAKDREDTRRTLERLQDGQTANSARVAVLETEHGETETQIDAVEQARNTADDTLRRDVARLSRAMHMPYYLPVEPSPRIADRRRQTR